MSIISFFLLIRMLNHLHIVRRLMYYCGHKLNMQTGPNLIYLVFEYA